MLLKVVKIRKYRRFLTLNLKFRFLWQSLNVQIAHECSYECLTTLCRHVTCEHLTQTSSPYACTEPDLETFECNAGSYFGFKVANLRISADLTSFFNLKMPKICKIDTISKFRSTQSCLTVVGTFLCNLNVKALSQKSKFQV